MDALICGILCVFCAFGSACGWKIFDKWYERVNAWKDNHKHKEEFMECLLTGWSGLMLAILCGIAAFFLGIAFLACIL